MGLGRDISGARALRPRQRSAAIRALLTSSALLSIAVIASTSLAIRPAFADGGAGGAGGGGAAGGSGGSPNGANGNNAASVGAGAGGGGGAGLGGTSGSG